MSLTKNSMKKTAILSYFALTMPFLPITSHMAQAISYASPAAEQTHTTNVSTDQLSAEPADYYYYYDYDYEYYDYTYYYYYDDYYDY